MYRIVPEEALPGYPVCTETRDFELAQKLAQQESAEFGVPHTVEEVTR